MMQGVHAQQRMVLFLMGVFCMVTSVVAQTSQPTNCGKYTATDGSKYDFSALTKYVVLLSCYALEKEAKRKYASTEGETNELHSLQGDKSLNTFFFMFENGMGKIA